MSKVCMPIETTREGNKITKVCVEDFSKVMNKIKLAENKAKVESDKIFHSVKKNVNGVVGNYIVGVGNSQPCIVDAFDEEIGNNIAFMKAKLNANLKKRTILERVFEEYQKHVAYTILDELDKLDEYIDLDLEGIRKHNPEYLIDKY